MRVILHSDLNAFYAAVECLHQLDIRHKPVAVCGHQELRHGIVLAKNQLAKQYGCLLYTSGRQPDLFDKCCHCINAGQRSLLIAVIFNIPHCSGTVSYTHLDEQSHHSQVVAQKTDHRLGIIEKYKVAKQEQVGAYISTNESSDAIARKNKSQDP